MHRTECQQAKLKNIKNNGLSNLEKSDNTANNTSMLFMNNYRKQNKEFQQWDQSQIY